MRALVVFAVLFTACGVEIEETDALKPRFPDAYASTLVAFNPGANAEFGHDLMPDVVFGPPKGDGTTQDVFDVVSLGVGGSIVLGFDRMIVDGPGPDFIVFENPFLIMGDARKPYKELGAIAVSSDGETWTEFDCHKDGREEWPGCAGWRVVKDFDAETVDPLDPAVTGGDPFDLADIAVTEARFVRIRDLSSEGEPPAAGFDLDSVGAIHLAR